MNKRVQEQQFRFGLKYIKEHFGTNTPLVTQQRAHSIYRVNPERHVDYLYRCLEFTGRESLLDVGCGNGFVLREIVSRLRDGARVVAVDISPTMLALARENTLGLWLPIDFAEGRAEDLSRYPDDSFDRVMANYIFHYIEEPDVVCAEIARVLDLDGIAAVAIEARHSMAEMYELHFEVMERVGFPADFINRLPRGRRGKMVLENTAETLQRHFAEVKEHPYVDALRFSSLDPFMQFYVAGHQFCGAKAMADESISEEAFESLYAEMEGEVLKRIGDKGYFELSKRNSVFTAYKAI